VPADHSDGSAAGARAAAKLLLRSLLLASVAESKTAAVGGTD